MRGAQVPIDRSELTLMVETTESARIKLYKQLEVGTDTFIDRDVVI